MRLPNYRSKLLGEVSNLHAGYAVDLQNWKAPEGLNTKYESNENRAHDWNFAQRVHRDPGTRKRVPSEDVKIKTDDAVAITPILDSETNDPMIPLFLHYRPTLDQKPGIGGLEIEPVGGINVDEDAGKDARETALQEAEEETGILNQKEIIGSELRRVPASAGITDESHAHYTTRAKLNSDLTNNPPATADKTALAMFLVPLKSAFNYMKKMANNGIYVSQTAFVSVFNALASLNNAQPETDIQPDFKTDDIPVFPVWNLLNKPRTGFQEIGEQRFKMAKTKLSNIKDDLDALATIN